MPINPNKTPIVSATQDFLDLADIIKDILITKNGTYCMIIQTTSVNFELLSPDEQAAKINAFRNLLNSLDFQMQILIETRKISISKYANFIQKLENPDLTPGLKRQFLIYKKFIKNLVTKQEILDKKFYIVIPYRSSVSYNLQAPVEQRTNQIAQALNYLYPKKNHIIKMLKGMGLNGTQLTTPEIIKYFYKIYNPEEQEIKFEDIKIKI